MKENDLQSPCLLEIKHTTIKLQKGKKKKFFKYSKIA